MESTQERSYDIELTLARLLRIGSLVAAALMVAGVLLVLTGQSIGSAIITAGLIALVSTPVMRVVVALIVFLRERDLLFAFFCVAVLASLVGGMVIGQAH